MSTPIAKNASYLTLASIGQKIIAFVYFTLVARTIGVEGTGKYFFALSFTTIFVVFVDLGLTNVLIREAAKAKDKMQQYVSTILSVKFFLGILSYISAVVVINILGYPLETRHLVYLSGLTMLFDSLHLTLYGVLRAEGDLRYEAIGIVGSQLITLCLGSIFLFFGFPLLFLILAFTIPSVLNVLYVTTVLYARYHIVLRPAYDRVVLKHLVVIAIPFGLAAIFARVYSYSDSILLSKLAGDRALGWYAIPYKITYAFQFVPLALVAALYPRFSEYCEYNKTKLSYLFRMGMKYLLLVAFPISVGIGVLARDIILTLYTQEYVHSIFPLQILLVGLVFSFASFPIGAFLNACHKQVTQTSIIGISMVVNIACNLALIPRYGVIGAALSALVGNMLLTVLGYLVVPKITHVSHTFLLRTVLQLLVASGVMGVTVWYVNTFVHFGVAIVAGVLVYPMMLFATGAITKNEMHEAMRLVRR